MAGLPYNGWSETIRYGRDKHYYHAQRKKLLPQVTNCTICRCSLPANCIPYHAEEYGPALEDYWASCVPLCHRCHAMLHARFITPNRWHRYIAQALDGEIDDSEYQPSRFIAPMLSRFKNKSDISHFPMPKQAPEYVLGLSKLEYSGPPKAATLKITDLATGKVAEVPDWTLYGDDLEQLSSPERQVLEGRGIDIDGFLCDRIQVERDSSGKRKYRRLYA